MTLKPLIVLHRTSERSYQPAVYLDGQLSNDNRIGDHLNDHQGNQEELAI